MKSASLPPSLPNLNEPTEKDADSRRYVFPKEPARESFASTFDSQAAKGVPNKRCFYEAPAVFSCARKRVRSNSTRSTDRRSVS